jgi:hypothetical protein
MGRAMVLARRVPLEPGRESLSQNLPEERMALVWEELKAIAQDLPHGAQEMPPEVGVLNLGPFASRPFVTAAAAHQMRKARALLDGDHTSQVEAEATA